MEDFGYIDEEEKEMAIALEKAIKEGSLKSVSKEDEDRINKKVKQAYFEKYGGPKRLSLEIAPFDLRMIKARAHQEGLPYQTLIKSVMKKYVSGQLIHKN